MARGLAGRRRSAATGAPPHQRTVLPNGLRVVSQELHASRSVAVAIFVGVGSRYEASAEAGLSHLVEHLAFKGTERYPQAGAISEMIEGGGGGINAATDRELTVYSARVPRDRSERAFEVISELVLHPLLRASDLVAEKPVIVDEIRAYVDSPTDHVFTLFDELLFGDHPLGREVAGTPRSVRRASIAAVRAHWAHWYQPRHLVLAVAGAISHAEVVAAATLWFTPDSASPAADRGTPRTEPPVPGAPGRVRVAFRRLTQGNLCLGMPGVSRADPDRWALELLGALLGDGMSSRLFLELRERRSLTYDVGTFSSMYADCGTLGVHAGFDPSQATVVVAAVIDQLRRVVEEPVGQSELERARAYTRGRLELRMDDPGAVASWLGTGESLLPRILTVDEVAARLEEVDVDDLLRVARKHLRPDQARLVLLGPFRRRHAFEELLAA